MVMILALKRAVKRRISKKAMSVDVALISKLPLT